MTNLIEKVLTTTTDDKIWIYDNVFTAHEQFAFSAFVEQSLYQVGTLSYFSTESTEDSFLRCQISEQDLDRFGIFKSPRLEPIAHHWNGLPKRYWFTLSTYLSQYRFHCDTWHEGTKTFVYYTNMKWDIDWGGETLFCNKNGDVELAVEYKPNRAIVFDNHLKHKPVGMSVIGHPWRFAFVAQW